MTDDDHSLKTPRKPAALEPIPALADSIAPFNPSSLQAQDNAIRLLALKRHDVLYDLGCGDARLLLRAAAQVPGLRCVGIELDPRFVQRGRDALAEESSDVQRRVDIRRGNLLEYDQGREPVCFNDDDDDNNGMPPEGDNDSANEKSPEDPAKNVHRCRSLTIRHDATAIYLYLLPKGLARFKAEFLDAIVEERMQQGRAIRIVAFMFRVHGWEPVAIDEGIKGGVRQYLYEFGTTEI